MTLSSLHRGRLAELAAQQLGEQLASGAWPVGSRLPSETELASALGVGRSTVREAVRMLAHAGLLETRQGSGTYVLSLQAATRLEERLQHAEILEVYEVRQALEFKAAVLAAERRTPADIKRIKKAIAARRHARVHASDREFVAADVEFHKVIVAAAHNPLLEELFGAFASALTGALTTLVHDEQTADLDSSDAHDELAQAIIDGDVAAATRATSQNLDVTAHRLRELTP